MTAKEKVERVFGHTAVPRRPRPARRPDHRRARTLTGVGEHVDGTVADVLADNVRLTAEAQEGSGEGTCRDHRTWTPPTI
jgi:hypothetical protein